MTMDDIIDLFNREDTWSGKELHCRRCGVSEVYWQEIVRPDGTRGWRMHDEQTRRQHVCQQPLTPSADAFGVVPE
jgi:hypothetical protein